MLMTRLRAQSHAHDSCTFDVDKTIILCRVACKSCKQKLYCLSQPLKIPTGVKLTSCPLHLATVIIVSKPQMLRMQLPSYEQNASFCIAIDFKSKTLIHVQYLAMLSLQHYNLCFMFLVLPLNVITILFYFSGCPTSCKRYDFCQLK